MKANVLEGTKACATCKQVLLTECFWKNKSTSDGFASECKQCKKKYIARYRQENKDQLRQYGKQYQEDHPEMKPGADKRYVLRNQLSVRLKRQDWYQNNKDRLREASRIRQNQRRAQFGWVRKLQSFQTRLRLWMQLELKSKEVESLVGCTAKEFRKHFQSQFKRGMSWDNYGIDGWQIDHIRPCASFNLDDPEQVKKCHHYSNLQPLWASHNNHKRCIHQAELDICKAG